MKLLIESSTDCGERKWQRDCKILTDAMNKINPSGDWHVTVENFGWMKRSGYRNFHADNGEKFLNGILPDTFCTFKIYVDYRSRTIQITNAHHDNPTGDECYTAKRNK